MKSEKELRELQDEILLRYDQMGLHRVLLSDIAEIADLEARICLLEWILGD